MPENMQTMRVQYKDYLGFVRTGFVGYILPPSENLPEDERYCLIVDEEPEYNEKEFTMEDGRTLKYAEVRRSGDCVRIPDREKWSDETN